MTRLRKGDEDLHDERGEHRSTPPSTRGSLLAAYEKRLRRHLAEHEARGGEA